MVIDFTKIQMQPQGQPLQPTGLPKKPQALGAQSGQLDEASRSKLDGIVMKMTQDKQKPETIQLVVNDFKQKYGGGEQSTEQPQSLGRKALSVADNIRKTVSKPFVDVAAIPVQAVAKGLNLPDPYADKALSGIEVSGVNEPLKKLGSAAEVASYAFPYGKAATLAKPLLGGVGSKIAAGALGGYGMDIATNLQQGKTRAEAITPGLGTGIGAAIPAIGPAISKLSTSKLSKPFLNSFESSTAKTASKYGVELPASALSSSRAVPAVETLAGKGLFGQRIGEKVDNALSQIDTAIEKSVKEVGASTDPATVGNLAKKGFDAFVSKWRNTKNALYQAAEIPSIGKSIPKVAVPKTLEFVKTIIADKKGASKVLGNIRDLSFFRKLQNKLSVGGTAKGKPKQLPLSSIRSALKELNEVMGDQNNPVATGNRAVLQRIQATLESEFDEALKLQRPDLAKAIDKANSFYKKGIERINSSFGAKIENFADSPEKISKALVEGATTASDIPRLFSVVGAKAKEGVRSYLMNRIFEDARKTGLNGQFAINGVSRQIKKFGEDKLQAIFEPQQYQFIKDMQLLTEALQKGQKVSEGSQTAFIARIASEAALMFTNPLLGLKAILGDVVFSKFISSPMGQKYLTTGLETTGKTGQTIGRGLESARLPLQIGAQETR